MSLQECLLILNFIPNSKDNTIIALNFSQCVAEGNAFLKDNTIEMDIPKKSDKTEWFLKAAYALRDSGSDEKSFELRAELPVCVKFVYLTAWNIKEKPLEESRC